MGVFGRGGLSNNRFVLKPNVAIASEVSILSKNSLAITDFHVKKRSTFNNLKTPFLEPPIRDSQKAFEQVGAEARHDKPSQKKTTELPFNPTCCNKCCWLHAPPPQIDDQHRWCKTGGGACLSNSLTLFQKTPSSEPEFRRVALPAPLAIALVVSALGA